MSARNKINSYFHNSQFNRSSHEKLTKEMLQEYEKVPLEEFFNSFAKCLVVLFRIGEKFASVDLALDFAAKFSVSLYYSCNGTDEASGQEKQEGMPPFLKKLFDWLFVTHYAKDQSIRFRVCQFINKLLHNLGDEASLDDDLCDNISSNMLERLKDKVPAVRAQAVMALQRLQDPLSPDCPIIKAYLFHLSSDPSTFVRRSVLTIIGRTHITLPHILERTRDVKDTVRRHAYLVLSKLSIRSLSIKQRERLLREGLKDRSELVRSFVSEVVLPAWLRNMKGNYMDLLHALDVENSTETSILALKMLFKHRPLSEIMESIVGQQTDKLIPLDKLTPENVLFWRFVAQQLHTEGEEMVDNLEKIIPELTPFCQYIQSYYLDEKPKSNSTSWHEIQRQFVVHQLLELAKVFDLADEMGRSTLKKLIYDMLTCTHVKEGLVPVLVELLVEVEPNVNSRLQFLAEIVSEVHEPMTQVSVEVSAEEVRKKQIMQAKIRVQLNEIREEQQTAILEKDFLRAHTLVEKMKELEEEFRKLTETEVTYKEVRTECNDRATLSKCLTIIYEMMQSPTVTKLTPHLRSLMENFVMQYIEDFDTYVRSLALRATGVFCLLDQDLAKQYMLMFFYQLANNETDEVCIMALRVIFDIFHLFGLQPFQIEEEFAGEKEPDKTGKKKLYDTVGLEEEEEEEDNDAENSQSGGMSGSSNNFISILTSLLDSVSPDMRTIAAEGLCRLLLANRIKSPNLLSRLLIMWYNPVTEGDVYLRQMLASFFTTFASNSSWAQETLEQAFLPTLRTLFDAPPTSPLVEVDQDCVVRLLVNLTRPGINPNATQCNTHNNLAIALCNEVLVDPDSYNSHVLVRALTQLDLTLDDKVALQNIKTLTQTVMEAIKDKTCLRHIKKFQQILAGAEHTLSNGTGTNLDINSTTSVNLDAPLPENTLQKSPMHIDEEESEDSDNSQEFMTPYPSRKTVIPETPDMSDSPVSMKSADTSSSDMTQVDGEVRFQTPAPNRSSSLRRSGRLAKRGQKPD